MSTASCPRRFSGLSLPQSPSQTPGGSRGRSAGLARQIRGAGANPLGRCWTPTTALALCAVTLAFVTSGCATQASHVASDDAHLGRVVVYRNGIAFFERRAHVAGDHLVLNVPDDKVDDFLKSLKVADAKTGRSLPVAFPTRPTRKGGVVEMRIQLPGPGPHDLVISYLSEAPAWKPSYRVVVDPGGKVNLLAWAVVDNISGDDWRDVRIGVGSSSALSFRYDLRTVRHVQREQLGHQQQFVQAPPTGGSTWKADEKKETVVAVLADAEIPRPSGHPDRADDLADAAMEPVGLPAAEAGGIVRGDSHTGHKASKLRARGREEKAPQTAATSQVLRQRVQALASSLSGGNDEYVIQGYASVGERDGRERALDRANTLRNELIRAGVAPGRLAVAAADKEAPQAGVRLVRSATPSAGNDRAQAPADDGRPIGESHFESKGAMTVLRGTSAMVPIIHEGAKGEAVYLYDAEAARGDDRFAFRAVRFANPTDSTLEGGPMTVYSATGFVGEGLTESVPPRATAVVPYALDRQVVVERSRDESDRIEGLDSLHHGVLTARIRHARTTRLRVTNRLDRKVPVYVRHTVSRGWNLASGPKDSERSGHAHLFHIDVAGSGTETVEIVETTPLVRTLDLRSREAMDLLRHWLADAGSDEPMAEHLREVIALHGQMLTHREVITSLRQRNEEYRLRMQELEEQVLSLQAYGAGAGLSRHLKAKLREMSDHVQETTIETVSAQEQLMVTRIRLQEAIAELRFEPGNKGRASVKGDGEGSDTADASASAKNGQS